MDLEGESTAVQQMERYPVGRFSKFVVRWPSIMMLICFAVSAGLATLAIMNNAFDALGGWTDFESIITRRNFAVDLGIMEWQIMLEDYDLYTVEDEIEESRRRLSAGSSSIKRGGGGENEREGRPAVLSKSFHRDPKALLKPSARLSPNKKQGGGEEEVTHMFHHQRKSVLSQWLVKPLKQYFESGDSSSNEEEQYEASNMNQRSLGEYDDMYLCDKQTMLYDEYSILFAFRDASMSPLSDKSLKSFKQAQKELYNGIPNYKTHCLLNNQSQCTAGYSMVNWAHLLEIDPRSSASSSSDVAQCLNLDATVWNSRKDKSGQCGDSYGFDVPCSTYDKSDANFFDFATFQDMEPIFKAICQNGTTEHGSCGEDLNYVRQFMFGNNWDCDSLETRYTRAYFPAGAPPYDNADCAAYIYEDEMLEDAVGMIDSLFKLKDDIESSNDDMTFYFYFYDIFVFFDYYLAKDLSMVALSFVLVFFVLWFQTSSVFITLCGLYQIFISFPCGLFVWSVLMNEPGVTYLMYNGIFIILGIGCDDIFVILDAFRQSSYEDESISGSLETRFAWAFNRAASAMLATSVTTAMAFGGCAFSNIWDIRCFGVVNGFMVVFNYILVITWFPAAVCIYEKYLKYCMPWCTPQNMVGKCVACITCSKTLEEKQKNASTESSNAETGDVAANEFADDLMLVKAKSPMMPLSPIANKTGQASSSDVGELKAQPSATSSFGSHLEKFYGGVYSDWIIEHRRRINYFFLFLMLGTTVLWVLLLKPATKPFSFFGDDHYFQHVLDANKEFNYVNSEGQLLVRLSFGLKKSDPWSSGGTHDTEVNSYDLYENTDQRAKYDPDFNVFDHQNGMIFACETFQSELVRMGESRDDLEYACWMKDFRKFVASDTPYDFPFTNETLFLQTARKWAKSNVEGHVFSNFSTSYYNRYYESTEGDISSYGALTGFAITDYNEDFSDDLDTRMYFTFATFQTKLEMVEDGYPNDRMWRFYNHMQKAMKSAANGANIPQSVAVQSCEYYQIMTLTSYLATSAMLNMVTSFAIAMVVIYCVTYDIKIAAISGVALYTIISLVFAEMAIFGWTINLLESVDISIAGGMSVDYLLHLIHAYKHQEGTSHERVRSALAEMGVSVTSGLITTFIACIALFFTDMLWFRLFGCFIAMVIFSAFFVAMVGMMALLADFGPDSVKDETAANKQEVSDKKEESKTDVNLDNKVVEMTKIQKDINEVFGSGADSQSNTTTL